jgi:carbon monoxide dehydrogenase subunit G
MDVSGSYAFTAAPVAVWNLLIDPEIVGSCLPGCDRLEPIGEDRYRAALTLAVATIAGQYTGTIAMVDKRAPHSYRLLVDGAGKAGFLKGEATIELVDQNGTTIVEVKGQGHVGGLMARVGQRLLGSVSKTMMDRFFACLQAKAAHANGSILGP